jgi:hypothetical protein
MTVIDRHWLIYSTDRNRVLQLRQDSEAAINESDIQTLETEYHRVKKNLEARKNARLAQDKEKWDLSQAEISACLAY